MSDSVAKNEAFRLYRDEKWPKELLYKEKYEKIRQELKEAFDGIEFIEDTHRYFYKGQELVATSNVCHLFRNYFDSDAQAERCSNKYWDDESSKYYHMTKQEILDAWEANSLRATTHGTKVHLFGQNVGNWLLFKEELFEGDFEVHVDEDGREYVETTEPKEIAILKYFKALPLSIIPIQFEIQMFSLKYGISGTADLLFLHDPDVEKDDNYDVIKNRLYLMDYKGLPIDTPILTTEGWKTMGTISEGDFVYDKDGKQVEVLHTSDIHYNPCYRITFDNGDSIVADHEHRWLVSFKRQNQKFVDRVMTTEELCIYLSKTKRETYYIPKIKLASPINNDNNSKLLIDPYVLGVWLGDGNSYSGHITNMYEDLWKEIEKRGYSLGKDVSNGHSGKAQTKNVVGLTTKLKKLGVLKNKQLPESYLLGSYEQRLDVLRGLMDTDGYYNRTRNRFVMTTTKKWQVETMVKLLSSLGVKATVIKAIGRCTNCPNKKTFEKYDITFYMEENPFLIRNINIKAKTKKHYNYRTIVKVEKTDTVPTRCIEVDSQSHTYLCGFNMLVTHNTNADLYKAFDKMLEPFQEMDDNDLGGYLLQAAIYSKFIEDHGFKFVARCLIWLLENGEFEKVPLQRLTDVLFNYLDNHPLKELMEERRHS